ncbi:hypothetical protein S40288_08364 [Stachybotrys chartarum IBT 40288]|nr:hypothetical protein S40288_08364 [Stachybotrys chartarum IBT 40288]
MARTRATKSTAPEATEAIAAETTSRLALPAPTDAPSKILVIPKCLTPEARIVTLPHPRHARPSRYLVCPKTGMYEFTRVAAPKTTPRSWLIEQHATITDRANGEVGNELTAHVTADADLFVASLIDPAFILLPALSAPGAASDSGGRKNLFLSGDDYFDRLPEEFSHLSEILQCKVTRALLEARLAAICDTVEAGDETMYRLSEGKLLSLLIEKAGRMSKSGLPASMELKFVKKPLEAPITLQNRAACIVNISEPVSSTASDPATPQLDTIDSQSSSTTIDTQASFTSESTAATSVSEMSASEATFVRAVEATSEVVQLQRMRVAFNFICSSYIPIGMAQQLQEQLTKSNAAAIDFTPLDAYLSKVATLREEALAARPMEAFSRKHGRDEIEDEIREKKRKLEEEKKKKSKESRATMQLKKVDTTGMKKLSSFFKKK